MFSFKNLIIFIIFLYTSAGFAQQVPTVVVLDFENQSSQSGNRYAQKAADLMINELSRKGINVVERKRLDALIQEQAFQSSGNVDPQTAVSIGKMLGANVIVLGTITKLSVGQNTVRVADSAITRYNAQVEITIRAVNVQTGAIIFSDSEEASAQAKSASVPDFDMGNKAPSVEGPLKVCINKLTKNLVTRIKGTTQKSSKPSVL